MGKVTFVDMFQFAAPFASSYGVEIAPGDLPHHVLIFRLYNAQKQQYRAFCAGSIIGTDRVLSSANCFLTNRKSLKIDYSKVTVVGGIVETIIDKPPSDHQQWRNISRIQSQRFYRFPAYNLAILIVEKPWKFNNFVNKIPFETSYHDFDGVCMATAVKATTSWSLTKAVYTEEVEMIKRINCEKILQRSCRLYFCTDHNHQSSWAFSETEGGGLVCHDTGDPAEENADQGILVGVTSIINVGLPSLHVRIGSHYQWVKDRSCNLIPDIHVLESCVILTAIHYLVYYRLFCLSKVKL